LRFLPALRWQIIVTGLAAVLVATVVGYLVARTVTRPVRALTATMREMAATGDLARAVPSVRPWDDEDARLLAATFRQLTAAIDRFQKEAAQRERLSSLGRLSTVVAHEIRNPLMIIKGAVRTLRRQTAPDVVELASSIDEEVARLNRVVTGVLDFARPITLDLAPDDLATICQDAAQAARASAEDLPIAVDTADLRAAVVTDAERVRAVLVNVLGNAQQAVRAAGRPIDGTSICMRLRRAGDGRWRIDVADTGGGIAPDDLPRIFDPFFTTRRGGSGLGLAIARNIIEGLGGTITIESQLGAGTTVRIELPDRAPGAEVRP
jgi:signal transduction histidine kinase